MKSSSAQVTSVIDGELESGDFGTIEGPSDASALFPRKAMLGIQNLNPEQTTSTMIIKVCLNTQTYCPNAYLIY